jgi:RNA polymerase sigma-70 factor (ECF subfamily)
MSTDFHTTHWSVVLTAKGDDTAAKAALAVLCETYYQPILKSLQRIVTADHARLYGGRDAADLTHDFFARILEGKMFTQLQRDGAPFRIYLLGALRHFLSQLRIHESAQKRGGSGHCAALRSRLPMESRVSPASIVSLELTDEPAETHGFDDAVFDRDWALAMIQRAMRLLEPAGEDSRDIPTKRLLPWITQEMNAESRNQLAAELGLSDTAVKVALHRLRKKFRHTIRTLIAETVKNASDIDAELDHLIRALR